MLNFLLSLLPIVLLVTSLSLLKMSGYKACALTLFAAAVVSFFAFKMPAVMLMKAALEGCATALWPISLVIIAALFTYALTLHSGAMEDIKALLSSVSSDIRILELVIVWGFGVFMEGMAGFGTAVAIPSSMLCALGVSPMRSVLACLVANTTPTAFGSVGIPCATLSSLTGVSPLLLSGKVAVIQSFLTILSPFFIVALAEGSFKRIKGVIIPCLLAGIFLVVPWYFIAKFMGGELPNIAASLISTLSLVIYARIKEKGGKKADGEKRIPLRRAFKAASPFILVFVFLLSTSPIIPPVNAFLNRFKSVLTIYPEGKPTVFMWINTPGTLIFLAAVIASFIQGTKARDLVMLFGGTLKKYLGTVLTVCFILAAAKIMIYSGMILTIANFLVSKTEKFYPFVAPLIGELGAFMTGSATSTSVLFGNLQLEVAKQLHLKEEIVLASHLMGAGVGKMICPQCISIGAASGGLSGKESHILSSASVYFFVYTLITSLSSFFLCLF